MVGEGQYLEEPCEICKKESERGERILYTVIYKTCQMQPGVHLKERFFSTERSVTLGGLLSTHGGCKHI